MMSPAPRFEVPASLQQRMNAALAAVAPTPDEPGRLGAAAIACLRDALERCDDRAAALHLLAADALITRACELAAGAEDDGAALRELCDAFDVHRICPLVDS